MCVCTTIIILKQLYIAIYNYILHITIHTIHIVMEHMLVAGHYTHKNIILHGLYVLATCYGTAAGMVLLTRNIPLVWAGQTSM